MRENGSISGSEIPSRSTRETVPCPGCGEPIPLPSDPSIEQTGCPNCFSILEIEREWIEETEAEPSDETTLIEEVPQSELHGPNDPSPAPARTQGSGILGILAFLLLSGGMGFLGFELWQARQRIGQLEAIGRSHREAALKIEERLEALIRDHDVGITRLSETSESLDSAIGNLVTDLRLHNSTLLRNGYNSQTALNGILRQERKFGELALEVAEIERIVTDKNKEAKLAHQLAVERRADADRASKPIKTLIKELEEKKTALLVKHQRLSNPSKPEGVVSKTRASSILNDWNARIAPLLAQTEKEIEELRQQIETEQGRIDDLYEELKHPPGDTGDGD